MNCLTVNSCCCCISLRTSGIILGILEISVYALNLISMHEYEHTEPYLEIQIDPNDIKWVAGDYIISLLGILVNAFWLYGIFKNRPILMISELIWSLIFVILVFIVVCVAWVLAIQQTKPSIVFFPFYCVDAVLLYFWAVRFSLYKSIKTSIADAAEGGTNIALNDRAYI